VVVLGKGGENVVSSGNAVPRRFNLTNNIWDYDEKGGLASQRDHSDKKGKGRQYECWTPVKSVKQVLSLKAGRGLVRDEHSLIANSNAVKHNTLKGLRPNGFRASPAVRSSGNHSNLRRGGEGGNRSLPMA